MEFSLDNENIQIRIKDEKSIRENSILLTEGSLFHKISSIETEGKGSSWVLSQIENQNFYTSSFVLCEVMLRLDDYYLINNIKLFISEENDSEITINKIKFQNVNSRLWEWSYFFDPDNKEIISRTADFISIFSVGLTDYIKIQFFMKFDDEFEGDTTTNSNNELLALKKMKYLLSKIVIYSQYIYSIPNATFLMTLLNLNNFFQNYSRIHQSDQNSQDNYLCSLYLTASSMIQARLFIQALELLKNLQLFIVDNINIKNFNFFAAVFEIHPNQNNYILQSISVEDNQPNNGITSAVSASIPIFLTKIELIKAVCMFEHGHWHIFLSFLHNCIKMFYSNDLSCINSKISLTKVNEIASDKFHIQNFLISNGNKLVEILMSFLKDKNELLVYSVLKVIEFIVDYHPQILFNSISKIIKHLFKLSYYYKKAKQDNQLVPSSDTISIYKRMKEENIFFPVDLLTNWLTTNEVNQKQKGSNNQTNMIIDNNTKRNVLSQVLQKQINYTLDTIITNIDNFSSNVVFQIAQKTHMLLFDIINHSDKDNILYLNGIKLLKKCFINNHTSVFHLKSINSSSSLNNNILTSEFLFNLFVMGIKPAIKTMFKDYLQIQNAITSINKNKSSKNSKEVKDMMQSANMKANITSTLLNTHSIIEGNDTGNLLILIFDKVSDQFINCFEKDACADLLNWINRNLALMIEQMNPENEFLEFTLYYTYLLLQFSFVIIFPIQKNEIKREMYSIPLQKHILFQSQFIHELDVFVDYLFKIEEFTLINRPSLILFEIIVEILNSINDSFGSVIDFKFESYFQEQYSILNKFIKSNGIFNENVTFLLKTLPLCSLNETHLIASLKEIYHVILINFTNYYNEESFKLFTLILSKLDQAKLIDDVLFKDITKAIISKANYKGNSVRQCYNKYFEIIYFNLINKEDNCYYKFSVSYIIELLIQYKEKLKRTNDKVLFKDFYLEMLEMIELIKSYYEYAKGIQLKNEQFDKQSVEPMMIFTNDSFNEELVSLMKLDTLDETLIAKVNGLLDANFSFLDLNEYCEDNYSLLITQAENGLEYFRLINKTNNPTLLNENCKSIAKIVILLNKFDITSSNALIARKLKLFIELFNTVNLELLKNIQLKNLLEDLMNFFECLIIPINQFDLNWNNDCDSKCILDNKPIEKEYYSLILKVLTFHLESNDELQNFFGIEILLKLFNVKMDESTNVEPLRSKLQSNKQSLLWLNSITEKIIRLISHSNYKISLFAIYIIQLLTIDRESLEPILQLKLMSTSNKKATTKLSLKEKSSEINDSFYWMNNQEISALHIFIHEKIILEYKPKITDKDDNASNHQMEEDDVSSLDKGIKVDEINDDDIEDEDYDSEETSIIPQQINYYRPNEAGSLINQQCNIPKSSKDDEDNLTLEELGVVEVDDEIFDNFDEENIPILKSNCVRAKGFAAKLRTNQNSRSLLMSEHVHLQNQNETNFHQERYHNSNENINEININYINQNNTNEEFGDVPDLTTKKKNIRPLNGLRPATPPLKNNNIPSTINTVNYSSKIINHSNTSIPIQNNTELGNKSLKSPNKLELNEDELNLIIHGKIKEKPKEIDKEISNSNDINKNIKQNAKSYRNNIKKINRCRSEDNIDKIYDIQSMEELFIDQSNQELNLNSVGKRNTGKEIKYSSASNQKLKYQSKFQKPSLNMNLIGPTSSSFGNCNSKIQTNSIQNKKDLRLNILNNNDNTIKPSDGLLNELNDKEAPDYIDDNEDEDGNEIDDDEVVMNNQHLNFNNNLNIITKKQPEERHSESIDEEKFLEDELDEILYQDPLIENKSKTNYLPIKNDFHNTIGNSKSKHGNAYNLNKTSLNEKHLSSLGNKHNEMNNTFTFSNNHHNCPDFQNSRNLSFNNINQNNDNSSSRKAIKNIHHLHNIQKKSSSSQGQLNLLQTMADIKKNNYVSTTKEDFRSEIKKKITQNSNKIINNLKKFSKKPPAPNTDRRRTIKEEDISEKSFTIQKKPNSNTIFLHNSSEAKTSGTNTPNFNYYNTINTSKP